MRPDLPLFPEQASTIAPEVDALYFLLVGVSAFMTLAIALTIFYFGVKYRRRSDAEVPKPSEGGLALEITWTTIPLIIFLGFFTLGAKVFFDSVTPPPDSLEVLVVGKQWMWHLQHVGGQREINELHIPVGVPIKLTMTSQDVIHDFSVPAFRVKNDVLPDRYTTLWFQPTKVGKYHLFCAEYCGTDHSKMVGWIHVMEPRDFQAWLSAGADDSPASRGRKLFLKLQCITCHGTGDANARAPVLEAIYGKAVPLEGGGSVVVDDNYLRESILKPQAKVVAGFRPIMPSFEGQVNEAELLDVITFLRTLGPGGTPPRVEETEPPAPPAEVGSKESK